MAGTKQGKGRGKMSIFLTYAHIFFASRSNPTKGEKRKGLGGKYEEIESERTRGTEGGRVRKKGRGKSKIKEKA